MPTYVPLQSIQLTTSATSITFSGISQNYTDLVLTVNALGVGTNIDENCSIQINNDTTTKYSMTRLRGNGSTASADRESNASSATAGIITVKTTDDGTRNTYVINFFNYANTSTFKSWISRSNSTDYSVQGMVGLWRSKYPITSITFKINSNNFAAGSTFDLYGIKSGSPQALGGDSITTDGTYWIHTFRSTGLFTPLKNLTCDYYVLGGGASGSGGGSSGSGGGGGGGGSSYVTSSAITPQQYVVTVGAGGPTGSSAAPSGNVGNDSTFNSTTGGGGQQQSSYSTASPGGTGTTQNGGAGGIGYNSGNAQNGGAGYTNPLDSITRGGGGGGSTKSGTQGTGTNGGGNGVATGTGGNGTANYGGGGGGSAQDNIGYGGGGGSGIVIVRYPV